MIPKPSSTRQSLALGMLSNALEKFTRQQIQFATLGFGVGYLQL
jgi:hypothetical protein